MSPRIVSSSSLSAPATASGSTIAFASKGDVSAGGHGGGLCNGISVARTGGGTSATTAGGGSGGGSETKDKSLGLMSTGGTPTVGLGGGLGSLELELEDSESWLPMVGAPGAGGDATASTLASRPASAVTTACGSVTTGVSLAEEDEEDEEESQQTAAKTSGGSATTPVAAATATSGPAATGASSATPGNEGVNEGPAAEDDADSATPAACSSTSRTCKGSGI